MSKLTEIMKQIPLDELMGDTVQTTDNTDKNITQTTGEITVSSAQSRTNIRQSDAYVKRSGALVSAAAIAIVAIGGTFAYLMLSKNKPETSAVNSSSMSIQITPQSSSQTPSKSNKAILEQYIKNKNGLKEGLSDNSLDFFDVDTTCGYGLYRVGENKSTLYRVSSGKVTEHGELKGMTDGKTFELPYDLFETQIFEMGGSKYAALLVEMISGDGYYPAVTILKLDSDEPVCAGFGYARLTMDKYCDNSVFIQYDPYKYPTRAISLKDVFKVKDAGVTIDGIEYSFRNGDFVQTFRVNLEDFVGHKQGSDNLEILNAYTTTNNDKYAYGAYYDRSAGRSVLCKASGQTVVEYPENLFTNGSNISITGRIYNMQSYTVVNGDGGTKEVLVILADKVTGGGVAPMIVVLDITSESPVAVMSEPEMIDMTHYDKNATATKDGDTVIYNVSKFDDTIRTYCQTTDKGLKIDGKLFIIEGGKLVEGIR